MIQIGGIKRHVDDIYIQNILQSTNGSAEYRHATGEISIVRLEVADMGMRRTRIANVPPEVTESSIQTSLASNGEIVSIQDEIWPKEYRYKVANGVKVIMMKLAKHLPSQKNNAGQLALPSCGGQPVTCYGCGVSGHIINQACPSRRGGDMVTSDTTPIHGPMSRLKAPTTGTVLLKIELRWSPKAHRMTRHREILLLSTNWSPRTPR